MHPLGGRRQVDPVGPEPLRQPAALVTYPPFARHQGGHRPQQCDQADTARSSLTKRRNPMNLLVFPAPDLEKSKALFTALLV